MRVLVIGSNGQVGYDLVSRLGADARIDLTAVDRARLDLADLDSVRRVVRLADPNVVINAAAYTAVDRAESEPELARKINARAPEAMAEECRSLGALLVHYSTDYVFDGEKRTPYFETDEPNPLNTYGQTKLEGDLAILSSGARFLILRVSWVYSPRGRNFLLTMLRVARERKALRVVDDQHGAPTPSAFIAQLTHELISLSEPGQGLFHLAPTGQTTWCSFAKAIILKSRLRNDVEGITTEQFPTAARRPRNSLLSTDLVRSAFKVSLPSWQDCLEDVMKGLAPNCTG